MSSATLQLMEVDEAKITLVMDNTIDAVMASTEVAKRFPIDPNPSECLQPIAEHGFSALIRVKQGTREGTVLFDAGISRNGVVHNMDALKLNPAEIQAIIFSHGHFDHTTGLLALADRLGTHRIPLVLHPDALLERKMVLPNGAEINLPPPKVRELRRDAVEIVENAGPSMLVDNMVLVSGEVARTTEFEKGFPIHYAKHGDAWEPDPIIRDDQCAIVNVRGKGLVIITGCGHSGIINIIRHARKLTGIEKVYAVVGGFHLTGGLFESIIPATVTALHEIKPRYLMPGHCTGWSALHQIASAMPEAFIPNSVGTTLVLSCGAQC